MAPIFPGNFRYFSSSFEKEQLGTKLCYTKQLSMELKTVPKKSYAYPFGLAFGRDYAIFRLRKPHSSASFAVFT